MGKLLTKLFLILLIPLIFSIGIAPAIPFVSAQLDENSQCFQNQVLVKRYSDDTYYCLAPLTATIWDTYGTGKIVESESIPSDELKVTSQNTNQQSDTKPNIIVIMPDDVGWYNIGAYHEGIMSGLTPNIDKIAEEGMRFTDYYAELSCTAGRASLITGQLPIRTGLTTVGQAGADVGMPAEAPTIATVLKSMGYNTGQFGKNHLGDLNKFLPTVHGFDEFYGYLYHLDALEDPYQPTYPEELNLIIGPRNMIHSFATDVDDNTVEPRWGKVGKQIIKDVGPVPPERMKTLDTEILAHSISFMQKSVDEEKPFFAWINPSRMHVVTHLSDHYQSFRTPENGWTVYEAGMVEVDDLVGKVMHFLELNEIKENTRTIRLYDRN